jgi:hypothetical protein
MMQISPLCTIMYYAALVYVLTGNDTIYKAISDNHSPDEKIALDVVGMAGQVGQVWQLGRRVVGWPAGFRVKVEKGRETITD